MTKHTSIAAALSALQGDMPTVKKDKTVRTGKYSYTYADLASVMAALAPHLKENGLSFAALPVTDEHGFRLEGHLMHESGERLTGSLPLSGRTPQEVGSALTYARRYLLGCLTGVVTDEDDDGQAAHAAAQRRNSQQGQPRGLAERIAAAQAPTAHPQAAQAVTGQPATPAQRKKIMAQFGEVGKLRDLEVTRDNRLAALSQWTGRDVASSNDLTADEAALVISQLDAWIGKLLEQVEQAQGELGVQA